MAKPQLAQGSLPSLRMIHDWKKKAAEWSWQVSCERWVRESILHGSRSRWGEMADRLARGKRANVKMSNIKPAGDFDAEVVQREGNERGSTERTKRSTKQGRCLANCSMV